MRCKIKCRAATIRCRVEHAVRWLLIGAALAAAAIGVTPALAPAQDVVTRPLQVYGLGGVESVAYSPDGTQVLLGAAGNALLYDAGTGRRLRVFCGHSYTVYAVAFSPDGAVSAAPRMPLPAIARQWEQAGAGRIQEITATTAGRRGSQYPVHRSDRQH